MVTQVDRSICSSRAPSWCTVALVPVSAMKRNGLPSFREAEPAAIDDAFQNFWDTSADCLKIFIWSISLVMMMYHEPMDISDRMISVPLETKSPSFHSASIPYGLATASFSPGATAGLASGAAAGAASAAGAAAASAAGAEAAGALA